MIESLAGCRSPPIIKPTFRTLSVTLKYLTLKALTGKGYAILVQMNYLRLIENNLILLR
jgi:hypothetical protein